MPASLDTRESKCLIASKRYAFFSLYHISGADIHPQRLYILRIATTRLFSCARRPLRVDADGTLGKTPSTTERQFTFLPSFLPSSPPSSPPSSQAWWRSLLGRAEAARWGRGTELGKRCAGALRRAEGGDQGGGGKTEDRSEEGGVLGEAEGGRGWMAMGEKISLVLDQAHQEVPTGRGGSIAHRWLRAVEGGSRT
eukprot:757130-Hanusia_phi.AAC.1